MSAEMVSAHVFPEAASSYVTLVNGVMRPELSQLSGLPKGTYVGSLQGAPTEVAAKLVGAGS